MSANDRRAKVVGMEAINGILLNNKCCRATRKKHKRIVSKVIRRDGKKIVVESVEVIQLDKHGLELASELSDAIRRRRDRDEE